LKRVEKSGRRETARRLRGVMGSVVRLAVVTLRATGDPTHAVAGALLRANTNPRAAITEERKFGALVGAVDDCDGSPTIKAALKLLSLTFARPGEVHGACRSEILSDKSTWRIPAERAKTRRPHDVPLSRQALDVIHDMWPLSDDSDLLFRSIRSASKPLSENALNAALRRMGFGPDEMTAHGFRASASTILNEREFNPDVIEAALAHQHETKSAAPIIAPPAGKSASQ
jgi:integrase